LDDEERGILSFRPTLVLMRRSKKEERIHSSHASVTADEVRVREQRGGEEKKRERKVAPHLGEVLYVI
jgi:hypothetical protein